MTTTSSPSPEPAASSSRSASPGLPSASSTSDKAKARAVEGESDARRTSSPSPSQSQSDAEARPEAEQTPDRDNDSDEDNADGKTNGREDSAHASSSRSSSASGTSSTVPATTTVASAGEWQAVFSPAHNAYYFYNTRTQETTWTNPLQHASPSPAPEGEAGPSTSTTGASSSTSSIYAIQAAAAAQGIDPALAFLDPSLAAPGTPAAGFNYTAKFNARTGAFTRPDGRDPSHLSEYERAKRMSLAYFDVAAWEQEVEERKAQEQAEGKKRKRPTKKDLVGYVQFDCILQRLT